VRYEVNGGRIATWSLEAHVVDHCNLRCEHCCTLSPRLAARAVDPARLERDLRAAATLLQPHVFKLTGGEPLLHPRLVEVLEAARASGISRRVSMTTNALAARSAPDRIWRLLDRVTVSWYASAPLPDATLDHVRAACARHDVMLTVKRIDRFQVLDAPAPHDDGGAAAYRACWLKQRCHLIRDGRFYACTRPPHLAAVLGLDLAEDDGVPLHDPDMSATLLRYLERDEPLASCRHCLGASGPWRPHRQLPLAIG
jgi:hypothetical protein